MKCEVCNKKVLMASSYDYIHDQIVCKSCVEDHKLKDIDIEAFEGLLSQNPERSSLKESTDQIFLPTFLKGLSGFVLAINLLLTFKLFVSLESFGQYSEFGLSETLSTLLNLIVMPTLLYSLGLILSYVYEIKMKLDMK